MEVQAHVIWIYIILHGKLEISLLRGHFAFYHMLNLRIMQNTFPVWRHKQKKNILNIMNRSLSEMKYFLFRNGNICYSDLPEVDLKYLHCIPQWLYIFKEKV